MDGSPGARTATGRRDPDGEIRAGGLRRTILVDERGAALRLTWHPESEMCVVSIWHGGTCAATFRLPVGEVADLGGFLSSVLSDWSLDVLANRATGQGIGSAEAAGAGDSAEPGGPGPSGVDASGPGEALRRLRRAGRSWLARVAEQRRPDSRQPS